MMIAAVAASDLRMEVYRVTAAGHVEHRWCDAGAEAWTEWQRSPFHRRAQAVTALSGWDEQIEVFVLDVDGQVWNRWWWKDKGWTPLADYNCLGAPFVDGARHISAVNSGGGHFTVFVAAADGRLAVLPHVNGPDGPHWQRCLRNDALHDGWWPAFSSPVDEVYEQSSAPRGLGKLS